MLYSIHGCLFLLLNWVSTLGALTSQDVPLLKEAPEWLNPCRRTSNDLDECVRDTFQNMFPFLAKGIPEIGMDPFEPLHIDYVGIKKGQGPVTLAGSFKNLIIHGPSNTTAVYTRFDLKRNKLDIGLFIPTIKVDATYDLKGKLLLLPLVGVGHAKLHLKNVSTNVATDIYFPKMAGEEVMVASSMKVNFSLTHMRVYLDNLFNGNKVLGLREGDLNKDVSYSQDDYIPD
ncbi:hypothetical protein M8J75_009929 [Diaphorina citri]|nr:hypothetical protein M8J75_009929 [Diaphorina citri]